jgi:translocation and assembly module TamB
LKKKRSRLFRVALGAIVLLGAAAFVSARWQVREGRSLIAEFVSHAASSPGAEVSIDALEDLLSSRPVLRGVSVADRKGVWLKVDHVAIDWSPLSLLALRLDVDSLEIGRVDIARRPAPDAPAPKPESEGAAPSLPDLPLRIRLGRLALGELSLAEPVIGAPAKFSVTGAAALGPRSDGARLDLLVQRLDAPGRVSARGEVSPGANALSLWLNAQEPEGGVIARVAEIPGLPPVEAELAGEGTLDDFALRLNAKAGESVGATGRSRLARQGAARRLDFDLDAALEPLLPKAVAALFAGTTRLEGAATIGDDGAKALDRLAVATSALRLDATGRIAPDGGVGATLAVHGVPPSDKAEFRAEALEATARISGTLARPEIDARLLIDDARSPAGRFGHVEATVKALAGGAPGASERHIDVFGEINGSDLAFADRALGDAIGETVSFTLRGRVSAEGDADISLAKLTIGAGEASFAGRAGPSLLDGRASVQAPSLARFARLAGRDLRGDLKLSVDLAGVPNEGRVAATLDGAIASPAIGAAALDRLLGRRLALTGKAERLADGGLRFDALSLRADHVFANVDGAATKEAADVSAKIAIPDLRQADPRLSGRADIGVKATGSLDAPDATFDAVLTKAAAAGRTIPKLALHGDIRDLTGALVAAATLDGTIDGKAARGALNVAKAGAGWKLDGVDIAIGRSRLKGAVELDGALLASGRFVLAAPDLDDFSAFALQKLAGRLDADVRLDHAGGAQNVAADVSGVVRGVDVSVDRLKAKIVGRDLLRRPALDGEIAIDNARVGGQAIQKARLVAKPAGAGTSLDLALDAQGYAIAARSIMTPSDQIRLDLQSLSAQRAGRRIALAGPATIMLGDGAVELKRVALAAGSGRLELDGTIGDRLDLVAKARALPLSIAAIADASLALDGALDGEARLSGALNAPGGEWSVKLAKVSAAQLRSNGLPPVDVVAKGALAGKRTTIDAKIALGSTSRIEISGSAPIDAAGNLDLAVKGQLDGALADTILAANGQTLRGKANIDARLSGPVSAPLVAGGVTLSNGSFSDPLNGVNLDRIDAKIEGRGREVTIARLTAVTKNGGQIAAMGRVSVAPEAGMPGAIQIRAKNAQLASTDIVSATADLDLAIGGPLARSPKVSGRVTLTTMEVSVPDRLPASLKALPDATHVRPRDFAKRMLALERKQKESAAKKSAAKSSGFDAALDLAISAPNRIFVRGRGVDAEFGGELRLSGTLQKPVANGAFDLRRGRLQLLTQRIDLTRGKLTFAGGLTPQLDFMAETTAGDVTARIGVAGPAAQPTFTFTSTPELPQDEVLSQLLFAKASGSLSPWQAVQLATAIAQFSGAGTGVDAFEKVRRALGVDTLDLEAGGGSGPTVGASRYISDNISVGVRTGTKPDQAAVSVGVDVTKNVRVKGETRVDGKSSLGVGVEWEY